MFLYHIYIVNANVSINSLIECTRLAQTSGLCVLYRINDHGNDFYNELIVNVKRHGQLTCLKEQTLSPHQAT